MLFAQEFSGYSLMTRLLYRIGANPVPDAALAQWESFRNKIDLFVAYNLERILSSRGSAFLWNSENHGSSFPVAIMTYVPFTESSSPR